MKKCIRHKWEIKINSEYGYLRNFYAECTKCGKTRGLTKKEDEQAMKKLKSY